VLSAICSHLVRHSGNRHHRPLPLGSAGAVFPSPQLAAMSQERRGTAHSLGQYCSHPLDGYMAQKVFHQINTSQPRLQLVHESPYIFVAPEFVTHDECERLMSWYAKAEECGPSAAEGGTLDSKQSETRTSTTAYPPPEEVHWLRLRIAELVNVPVEHLHTTKITKYASGQFFGPHIDTAYNTYGSQKYGRLSQIIAMGQNEESKQRFKAFCDGPTGVGSCPDRCISVFVYLNDVDKGGRTTFSALDKGDYMNSVFQAFDLFRHGVQPTKRPATQSDQRSLSIVPRAGMACIHFPTTVAEYGCFPDHSTMHESEVTNSTKLIVQQFIWARPFDKAQEAINAHSREYLKVALDGEKERGKKGVVLVEEGLPSRFVTAEDLSALPKQNHAAVQKLIQQSADKKYAGEIVVVEVDGKGGAQFFQVSREPSANGWLSSSEYHSLPSVAPSSSTSQGWFGSQKGWFGSQKGSQKG